MRSQRFGAFVTTAPALISSAGPAYAQSPYDPDVLGFFVWLALILAFFFVPTFIAFGRGHPNRWLILVVNAAFGATGLGWLGSLVWALHAIHRPDVGSRGGQTGLNLFANDYPHRQLAFDAEHVLEDLSRLKVLLDDGAIDQQEHRHLKARLLGTDRI